MIGAVVIPVVGACNGHKDGSTKQGRTDSTGSKKLAKNRSSKKPRKKWNHESLVLNTRSKVLHFPTALVYTYYDEIKPSHLQELKPGSWSPGVETSSHLNKEQSGNILEILTLKELSTEINTTTLVIAIDTLSHAFTDQYENANNKNFRLHELMLQLIALNDLIPADQKWLTFNAKIKRPPALRKRQTWMATEDNFMQRVSYISERRNDYILRLQKRASRYSTV
jgi:hypothetical protein